MYNDIWVNIYIKTCIIIKIKQRQEKHLHLPQPFMLSPLAPLEAWKNVKSSPQHLHSDIGKLQQTARFMTISSFCFLSFSLFSLANKFPSLQIQLCIINQLAYNNNSPIQLVCRYQHKVWTHCALAYLKTVNLVYHLITHHEIIIAKSLSCDWIQRKWSHTQALLRGFSTVFCCFGTFTIYSKKWIGSISCKQSFYHLV